jgi:hypothetical protein
MKSLRIFVAILLVFIAQSLRAQQDSSKVQKPKPERDKNITSFQEKQDAIQQLIEQQKIPLEKILSNVEHHQKILAQWSELLRSPKKVEQYRYEARDSIYNIRKYVDKELNKLKDMYIKWQPYTYDMMAVFTRYGELLVLEKVDEKLKKFILAYREHNDTISKILKIVEDITNECTYLLDSKLKQ